MPRATHAVIVKTLRFQLPVLAHAQVSDLLDLVTDVEGVAAALVDVPGARLDVVVSGAACELLVREEVRGALLVGASA